MVILVAEGDNEIRETVALVLECQIMAKVIQAATLQSALEVMKTEKQLDIVVSEFEFSDGTSDLLLGYLKAHRPKVPFILCSSTDANKHEKLQTNPPTATIPKPIDIDGFLAQIQNVIRRFYRAQTSEEVPIYFPIRMNAILRMGMLPSEIYLRLSDKKFVKVVNNGDPFSYEDYQHYSKKGISHLYVKTEHTRLFLSRFANDLQVLSAAKSIKTESAFEVSEMTHETLRQSILLFGLSDEANQLAKSCTNLALKTFLTNNELQPFTKKFDFTRKNYLSTHSVLLGQNACMIASALGWNSESTQFKLALAGLMHDITLENDAVSIAELSISLPQNSSMSDSIKKTNFGIHTIESAQLITQVRGIPNDIESIILAHHERPDGHGFPNQLKSTQIDMLPALFIIAHDLTNYMWLNDQNPSLADFVAKNGQSYQVGSYRKVIGPLIDLANKQSQT